MINYTSPGYSGGNLNKSSSDVELEQLVDLARQRGGSISEVVDELTHPKRSILSTIKQGSKNLFNDFIDTISVPGQVVAGMISPDYTIKEAIDEKLAVSTVLFGDSNIFDRDGDITTMEKVGDFMVRLPTDVVTDPLTYVSFGAGAGLTGSKAFTKITLSDDIARRVGLNPETTGGLASKMLTKEGQQAYTFASNLVEQRKQLLRKVSKQVDGELAVDNIKSLSERGEELRKELIDSGFDIKDINFVEDFTENELKGLLKETIEKNLDIDFAKRAVSRMIDNNPALVDTLIDKGGIKVLGKTILSSQRINSVMNLIPGMSKVDEITLPWRQSITSLFDTNLIKSGDEYVRLPEEFSDYYKKFKTLSESKGTDFVGRLQNIQKQLNLTESELSILDSAISARKIPSDNVRLATAYKEIIGFRKEWEVMLKEAGVPPQKMDNYVGLIFLENKHNVKRGSGLFSDPGSTMFAQNAKYIEQSGQNVIELVPSVKNSITRTVLEDGSEIIKSKYSDNFTNAIKESKSIQEVGFAIGKEMDDIIRKLSDTGMSMEDILKNEDVISLQKMRMDVDNLPMNTEYVGKLEGAVNTSTGEKINLKPQDEDLYNNIFVDKDGKVFKRFATSAVELEKAGFSGFDTNILTSSAVIGLRNIKQSLGQEFLDGMIRFFGKPISQAPESHIAIDSSALEKVGIRLGQPIATNAGEQIVFHPAIAKTYEDMMKAINKDELTQGFWDNFDKLQSYWKSSVTSIFPMFHGRNAISNVFLNFLDLGYHSFNPATHSMSADLIVKDRISNNLARKMIGTGDEAIQASKEFTELNNRIMFTDARGYKWSFGELKQTLKKYNIAFNKNITGASDIYEGKDAITEILGIGKETVGKKFEKVNPLSRENVLFKGGRETGRVIEEQARLVNFITNLKKTGDVSHAANRTKMFLFDYSNLTSFEKKVLRRLIPFYSFTKFNLATQAKAIIQSPGRISAEIKAVNSIGDLLDAKELNDKEIESLPAWMKNTILLKRKK